jgi:hypothetical protein
VEPTEGAVREAAVSERDGTEGGSSCVDWKCYICGVDQCVHMYSHPPLLCLRKTTQFIKRLVAKCKFKLKGST